MVFEELLDQAGGLGRSQILQMVYLLAGIVLLYPHILLENFTAAIPGHRCWVHILDNDTVSANDRGTLSPEALLRISIPQDSNLRPEKCRRFLHPQWQLLHLNGTFPNMSEPDTEPCVDGWVYDQSTFPSTIVTEWDLVCESQPLKPVAQFLFMAGSLVGGLIYGWLSDRFGRKFVLRCCFLQLAVSGTCAALAPNFLLYCSLRLLSGFAVTAVLSNTFILISEWTVPRFQALVVSLIFSAYSLGQILLGAVAFGFQDWRTLQLTLSIPSFAFFVLSSNWIMQQVFNIAVASHKCLLLFLLLKFVRSIMQKELAAAQIRTSVFDVLQKPKLRARIFYLSFIRLSILLNYFGLALNLQHLGSNIFLFQVLFGTASLTARYVALLTLNYVGRRLSQILFMFTMGLSIIVTIFVPQEMQALCVSLAVLGVSACAATTTSSSIHQNELIPTVFRATAAGINLMAGWFGAALAPLLMTLMVYSSQLPWIIYGMTPILASFIVLLLPETRNRPLPDTIEDVENE
ncbi:steroid transmembrane transporter SLC22A24-like [Echinops telfairi]|uniref:Steroid transmembrane transporter SLC22A24-like n=1 Tax=Echinops telfairi TaxID=9371 RepID=A0AC55DN06_ECHTE|nr:steroid transmembrane transporter SLC22A24-like [Echinops telfairi]